ncbi:hypothetical protein SUGI_0921290 [Cryptomeria japonica]|nr:hypothetical protein SUGI_0921290 [Cryptomeria japonica]
MVCGQANENKGYPRLAAFRIAEGVESQGWHLPIKFHCLDPFKTTNGASTIPTHLSHPPKRQNPPHLPSFDTDKKRIAYAHWVLRCHLSVVSQSMASTLSYSFLSFAATDIITLGQ